MDSNDVSDQVLHFCVGFFLTLILCFAGLPVWGAWLAMMVAAEVRELYQHDWSPTRQGVGSLVDLAFFAAGGAAVLLIMHA